MDMVALKEFRYAGRQIGAGDTFEARDRDVRVLQAIKRARLSEVGESTDDGGGVDSAKPPKRTNKRRDTKTE